VVRRRADGKWGGEVLQTWACEEGEKCGSEECGSNESLALSTWNPNWNVVMIEIEVICSVKVTERGVRRWETSENLMYKVTAWSNNRFESPTRRDSWNTCVEGKKAQSGMEGHMYE
jgi:hypothetical protein